MARISQDYIDYIRSEKWQKKRQQCFAYHGKRCKACGTVRGPIHVHHMDYTRLGKESVIYDLIPLCAACHKSVTKIYRSNRRRGLRRVTMEYVRAKRRLIEKRKRR